MTADSPTIPDTSARRAPHGWRWAPAWVLTFVALWPAPGYAEAVMVLGALAAIVRLLLGRFRGGTRLLSGAAWALTSALFAATSGSSVATAATMAKVADTNKLL